MKHFAPIDQLLQRLMPPTRGHDLKRHTPQAAAMGLTDAPHTGARLETPATHAGRRKFCRMPPTRGHDLKRRALRNRLSALQDAPHTGARLETTRAPCRMKKPFAMPPTRGHDLKLRCHEIITLRREMPPTRGHDLKLRSQHGHTILPFDAPHTGARLETSGCLHSLLTGM